MIVNGLDVENAWRPCINSDNMVTFTYADGFTIVIFASIEFLLCVLYL